MLQHLSEFSMCSLQLNSKWEIAVDVTRNFTWLNGKIKFTEYENTI